MIATDRLKDALATALDRYAEMMGEPFKTEPKLETVPDEAVWAVVQPDGTGCTITATEGIATALRDLWSEALDQQALLRDRDTRPANDPDELTAVSLSWLMHHEMEHFGLGHLGLVGARGFTETNHPNARALIARSSAPLATATDLGFDTEDMSAISRCLELQADHDAIGMITGPYSNEGWPELRSRVASIFAVMILIDREDRKRGEVGHTHPRAATRIFQLLGHMAIFWSVPAQKIAWEAGRTKIDPADLPPEAEIEAFKTEVVHPAFRDAALIAAAAGADDIAAELGDPTDFFADIALAHAKGATEPEGFKTIGAKEWAELYPINEAAMQKLGHRE